MTNFNPVLYRYKKEPNKHSNIILLKNQDPVNLMQLLLQTEFQLREYKICCFKIRESNKTKSKSISYFKQKKIMQGQTHKILLFGFVICLSEKKKVYSKHSFFSIIYFIQPLKPTVLRFYEVH